MSSLIHKDCRFPLTPRAIGPGIKNLAVPLLASVLLFLLALGAMFIWQNHTVKAQGQTESGQPIFDQKTVTCLGKLEPLGEVVTLDAPTSTTTVISELKCEEGDSVSSGQILAVLDSEKRLQAAVKQAEAQVAVARARLAVVKAGARRGEIEAQRSEIRRLESQQKARLESQKAVITKLENAYRQAGIDYKRYEFLLKEKAIASFDFDQKKLAMETALQELKQAKAQIDEIQISQSAAIDSARATFDRIAEVRPVDVATAEAELQQSEGSLAQAVAALEQAYIRSPLNGKVLKIYTRPGEKVSEEGFAEMGRTESMFALAEVYQSDISKIQLGQKVLVIADSLPGCKLYGRVKRIGQEVRRQNVINADPTANIDERVIEVRVQLEPASSAKVQHLSNSQITATIEI